jgi:hypothetical protein
MSDAKQTTDRYLSVAELRDGLIQLLAITAPGDLSAAAWERIFYAIQAEIKEGVT